ncbi:hypothetical protein [Siccirubricoccus phaeus]|uniref:hypothetical protein n=1 Tax=Siccirubricoccus phaeus TaxID=2595053 RepID=UPI0011F12FFC|nr:hypothetical protein [Siccirubricoccus phaeus]
MRRRPLLAAAAATLLAASPARAVLPAAAELLVPGPGDGPLAQWAVRLAASLARGATTAVALHPVVLGGPDGVTAANRFATAAAPDGRALLVLPGAALQARLIGDPRARFEASGWLPVCGAEAPVLLAGPHAPPARGAPPARIALPTPDHPGMAALLALDLLGVPARPVAGLGGPAAEAALREGAVNALLLQGADAPARLAALGLQPWLALDAALGPLLETAGPPELRAALLIAAAHARLQAMVVLPALTPGNTVALWRGAAQRWVEEGRAALVPGLRLLPGAEYPQLAPPPESTSLAYRGWLQRRLGWRAD